MLTTVCAQQARLDLADIALTDQMGNIYATYPNDYLQMMPRSEYCPSSGLTAYGDGHTTASWGSFDPAQV